MNKIVFSVRKYILENDVLSAGEIVLCAVSGGADSVCLLHILNELSNEMGFQLKAAHYNHSLRGEASDRDEKFVRELCERLNIPVFTGIGNVRREAEKQRRGIEETAREMRYCFLEATAEKVGASKIATAHTANDNAETVLFNMLRGTGSRGIGGIPPVRGNIIRPMLWVTREQIEEYLSANKIDHIEDETNKDTLYARNKLRLEVIPILKQINPRAVEHIAELSRQSRLDTEFLEAEAEKAAAGAERSDEGLFFDIAKLRQMPAALQKRVIILLSKEAAGAGLSSKQAEDVLRLTENDMPSARIDLPDGLTVRKIYRKISFERKKEAKKLNEIVLNTSGITSIPEAGMVFECNTVNNFEEIHNLANNFCVKCDNINGKLIVRSRKEGDKISLPGRNGTKTLKKLFIERKIPAHQRDIVPIIADDDGVVAVPGFGIDRNKQGSPGEKVLIINTIRT